MILLVIRKFSSVQRNVGLEDFGSADVKLSNSLKLVVLIVDFRLSPNSYFLPSNF